MGGGVRVGGRERGAVAFEGGGCGGGRVEVVGVGALVGFGWGGGGGWGEVMLVVRVGGRSALVRGAGLF